MVHDFALKFSLSTFILNVKGSVDVDKSKVPYASSYGI